MRGWKHRKVNSYSRIYKKYRSRKERRKVEKENKKSNKIILIMITVLLIAVIIIGVLILHKLNDNKVLTSSKNENNSQYTEETLNSSNTSVGLSDTQARKYVEKEFRHYNSDEDDYIIDKIEKYEEDGKGRYIYVLYWHSIFYQFGEPDVDYAITVYIIDATESTTEPTIHGVKTTENNLYQTVKNLQSREEYNWNK